MIYPIQLECAWIASDRDGKVAVFFTGGQGPIPAPYLEEGGLPIKSIWKMLDQLPEFSNYTLLIEYPNPTSDIRLSRRGLFVYDWGDVHRTWATRLGNYESTATPESPLLADELPEVLRNMAKRVCIGDVSFADSPLLDIASLLGSSSKIGDMRHGCHHVPDVY